MKRALGEPGELLGARNVSGAFPLDEKPVIGERVADGCGDLHHAGVESFDSLGVLDGAVTIGW